jgi:hypothetical protein
MMKTHTIRKKSEFARYAEDSMTKLDINGVFQPKILRREKASNYPLSP